jgi:hypothetical protein
MGKAKLIKVDENLLYKMRIAHNQEAMKGHKMTLDEFYQKIIEGGLKEHYKTAVKTEKPG